MVDLPEEQVFVESPGADEARRREVREGDLRAREVTDRADVKLFAAVRVREKERRQGVVAEILEEQPAPRRVLGVHDGNVDAARSQKIPNFEKWPACRRTRTRRRRFREGTGGERGERLEVEGRGGWLWRRAMSKGHAKGSRASLRERYH